MRERRFIKDSQLRAQKGDKPGISGYAAIFGDKYDAGYFIETIKRGAFTRALKERQDVRALLNHDPNHVLGRTKSDTLNLMQDGSGLHFDCDMPDTQSGNDVMKLIERGDLNGCSFAFAVTKQSWTDERDAKTGQVTHYREIEDLDLYDVSVVTYPAYEGTSVGARSLFPEGIPAEVRSHVPELRDTPDLTGEQEPDGDEPNGNECNCRCETCSGCTMRSAHPAEEKRDEDIAALVMALKEVSRIAALIRPTERDLIDKQKLIAETQIESYAVERELEKKQAIPEPDVPPVMSIEQAKAHIESLRASLSL